MISGPRRWSRKAVKYGRRRRHSGFDRPPELDLLLAAVPVPRRSPNPVEAPAEAFENVLAQAVSVTGDGRGVVGSAITLQAEREGAWPLGVTDGQVDTVTGASHPGRRRHSPTNG